MRFYAEKKFTIRSSVQNPGYNYQCIAQDKNQARATKWVSQPLHQAVKNQDGKLSPYASPKGNNSCGNPSRNSLSRTRCMAAW
jgi:hypothetical protein